MQKFDIEAADRDLFGGWAQPQALALPDGQNTQSIGQSAPAKIFHFTEIRKRRIGRATRPKEEGRIAIVTNAGQAAVDVDYIGAKGFAGRATVSKNVARTTGAICVRQNRVVLAPGVCASSLAVMLRPNRARASVICTATGAIVHRSPGRARHKP
ncbi:hypothetical protein [Bradyrhizobium sp. WSM2254]|uniref:hypothetical protein n=1 Tax=Bradyrhizobium sp. WSM2254 TaxID=1188263 RepID=UPI0012EB7B9E|nr:hypothetical protein [Bradyrhizobium sp. WSM2254]